MNATRARAESRILAVAIAGCAVAGLAISAYLTAVHYSDVPLACTTNQAIDCAAVTQSAFSTVGATGVPITLLGIAWFAGSLALALVTLRSGARSVSVLQLAWGVSGLAYILYLVYAEIAVIHRVCEWCTAVHLLVFVTFLACLRRLQLTA
jgi:uncharacterized membrane protein